MTRTLTNWATTTTAVMALTVIFGLATSLDRAEASLKYNFGGIEGSANNESGNGAKVDNPADMTSGDSLKRGAAVCCSLPRKGGLALLKSAECKKAKGVVAPYSKCPQAAKIPGTKKVGSVTLKRGVID